MKPYKILLFLLSVYILIFIISFFFPENGIKISQDIKLNFISPKEIFDTRKIIYADISDIIENTKVKEDTISEDNDTVPAADANLINTGSLENLIHHIQFPDKNKAVLYNFFRNIEKNKGLIRILHYGDSQIEGDRITAFLRNKIQARFGGSGAGLLPVINIHKYSLSVNQSESENWKKYTIAGKKDSLLRHNRYGLLGNFARFAPLPEEKELNDTSVYEGWLKLKLSKNSFINTRYYKKCKIYYGYNRDTVIAGLIVNDSLIRTDTLVPNESLQVLQWDVERSPKELIINFRGKDSPDIYAVALDNVRGIAVDNIPMRGSAGLDFTRMNQSLLKRMYKDLNVKLLILEFGVNVVPNIKDDYTYYENWFYSQLKALKALDPDLSIIVIGLSDMSRKVKDHYESYPNIGKIRDAQRNAAFRAGCAFWDIYEAMGGQNSMPSWVFADPPLGQKDFTHFTPTGAMFAAQMFYNAFIYEYNEYIKNK